MAYATVSDVQDRLTRELSSAELKVCAALLEDAGTIIDAYRIDAPADAKQVVSIRMVIRAIGSGSNDTPIGATQGSMSALGYSQSWTMGSANGGAVGELYLGKLEKTLLGLGNKIGSHSPTEDLVPEWGCFE